MFGSIFARLGLGAAKVDAVLHSDQLIPGGEVRGEILINGGDVPQSIDRITLQLMTQAKSESDEGHSTRDVVIDAFQICDEFELAAGEEKVVPFVFVLHPETPMTVLDVKKNQCQVWMDTALDIDMAVDPSDRDYLSIHPPTVVQYIIDEMSEQGFHMVKADVEVGHLRGQHFESTSGCYQEMEFKPKGLGFGRIKEIELSFICQSDQVHILIELDRRFSGDGYRSLSLPQYANRGAVRSALQEVLA